VNEFPKIGINTAELRDAVNGLIEKARRKRKKEDFGAVNWGDLGVVDIEYRLSMLDQNAEPWCVVLIEEAAPGCKLPSWIYERLDHEKFPRTYIECEW